MYCSRMRQQEQLLRAELQFNRVHIRRVYESGWSAVEYRRHPRKVASDAAPLQRIDSTVRLRREDRTHRGTYSVLLGWLQLEGSRCSSGILLNGVAASAPGGFALCLISPPPGPARLHANSALSLAAGFDGGERHVDRE